MRSLGGFSTKQKKRALMPKVRTAPPEALAAMEASFRDPRLPELLFRYRARNHPHTLTEDERGRWQEYRRRRLLGEGLGEQNLPAYFAQIDELRTTHADDAGKLALLDALAAWGRQLESTL